MKKIVAILLFFAFAVQTSGTLITLVAFYCNRNYIATNLCINRTEPKPSCKGSCYLKKQIAEQEQQQEKLPEIKIREITLFFEITPVITENRSYILLPGRVSYPPYSPALCFQYPQRIFKPPCVLI